MAPHKPQEVVVLYIYLFLLVGKKSAGKKKIINMS